MSDLPLLSRRALVLGLASFAAGCQTVGTPEPDAKTVPAEKKAAARQQAMEDLEDWYIGSIPDNPYDIPLVDRSKMDPELARQTVTYTGPEKPGSIVVEIDKRFVYFVLPDGKAVRYGAGVGRQGFSWRGMAYVGRKAVWPDWRPTSTMKALLKDLPDFMEGGVESPLGARALYLYQDGRDTLFRLHGTNEPWSIGHQVSSGCVRLLNEDIHDLFQRTNVGTTVIVKKDGRLRV
jgi:lipoprotein-anchoring transpeptidase ErfK/SrfK